MSFVRSSDGTRIHYRITGRPNGAPILFIQGLGVYQLHDLFLDRVIGFVLQRSPSNEKHNSQAYHKIEPTISIQIGIRILFDFHGCYLLAVINMTTNYPLLRG